FRAALALETFFTVSLRPDTVLPSIELSDSPNGFFPRRPIFKIGSSAAVFEGQCTSCRQRYSMAAFTSYSSGPLMIMPSPFVRSLQIGSSGEFNCAITLAGGIATQTTKTSKPASKQSRPISLPKHAVAAWFPDVLDGVILSKRKGASTLS